MRYEATARQVPGWPAAVIIVVAGLVLAGHAGAQCENLGTWIYAESAASRLNGNTVRLYNQTYTYGSYWNWWYNYISSAFYLNGNLKSSQPWGTTPQIGGTAWQAYSPTLQYWGPGQYYTSALHNAYTPYCGYWFWATAQPTADQIQIQRPTRPDYYPGANPFLWYLGGPAGSGQYAAQTVFAPGNPNGAPESPVWVISSESDKLWLSCTQCQNPNATATKSSAGCSEYDVVVKTSYNGFLSDPFYIFINRPHNTVAANDPEGGTWNWTRAWGNGWQSRVNYKTSGMCLTDPAMAIYDMNESFGSWTADYPGASWAPPSPNGFWVPNSQWYDDMKFQCPAGDCTPMPANPPVGCWPNCGTVKVQSAQQTFRVGSQAVGVGYAIQQNRHQRYQDHGSHESIVTPVPQ